MMELKTMNKSPLLHLIAPLSSFSPFKHLLLLLFNARKQQEERPSKGEKLTEDVSFCLSLSYLA